ncbi:hypothetical protein FAIPA1_50131 [Frankia sp. AiPs1]
MTARDVTGVRLLLRADCGRCAGLCCVVPGFAVSADFPISKAPGVPCRHLAVDSTCVVHSELRGRGFHGCVAFDCLGAGQRVTQVTFAGADWRADPDTAAAMGDVFTVMRGLHEALYHLSEALTVLAPTPAADPTALVGRLRALFAETLALCDADADELRAVDLDPHHRAVHLALTAASVLLRAADRGGNTAKLPARGHLLGARLAGADLRGGGPVRTAAARRGPAPRRPSRRGPAGRGPTRRRSARRGPARHLVPHLHAARLRPRRPLHPTVRRPRPSRALDSHPHPHRRRRRSRGASVGMNRRHRLVHAGRAGSLLRGLAGARRYSR